MARYIPLILSFVALAISYKVVEEGKAELREEVRQLTRDKENLKMELMKLKEILRHYKDKEEGRR